MSSALNRLALPALVGVLLVPAALIGVAVAQPVGVVQPAGKTPHYAGNQGMTWDSIKALPDWSGSWQPIMSRPPNGGQFSIQPPLTPAWQQKLQTIRRISAAGGDVPSRAYHCIPLGPPAEMGGPEALVEFLFTPGRVTIDSIQGWLRRIYLGQSVPQDPDLSFQGSSVGHWEGTTLVIETVGLDPGNELLYGMPIGKGAHLVERIHLKDPQTLQADFTVNGAESLTAPYKYSQLYRRVSFPMTEADCAQNNRDVDPKTGRQGFDIPPQN